MKLSKKKILISLLGLICLVVGIIAFTNNYNKGKQESSDTPAVNIGELNPVEDITEDADKEEEPKHELHDTAEITDKIDSKDFSYDPFAEDAGWGMESIFGSKIIVEGTGKRDESSGSGNLVIGDTGEESESTAKSNTREMTPAESQAAFMEKVKSPDYTYRINVNDFSNGFGVYMNPKYDLSVGRIMDGTGYISGPNDTDVGISELDPSMTLDEHRGKLLKDSGYSKVYRYSDGAILEYGTPITLGSGIDDFENTHYYNAWRCNDESMNDYGGQLFCDTEVKSKFGEGYYIELYNATSNLYYGYYLCNHNGRMFKAAGSSMYQDTLLDVVLATMDTCVYPY